MISMVSLDYSGICTSSRSELLSRKKDVYYVTIICNYALALLHKPINLTNRDISNARTANKPYPKMKPIMPHWFLSGVVYYLSDRFSGIYYFRPRTYIFYLVRTEFTHSGIDLAHSYDIKDFSNTYYPCHTDSRYAMNAAYPK